MRHPLTALLLASLLVLTGCGLFNTDDGSSEEESDPVETFFTATVNGEPWEGEALGGLNCKDTSAIHFEISGDRWHERIYPYHESLILNTTYEGPGSYSLTKSDSKQPTSSVLYSEVDGDVTITSYSSVGDSSANQLKITDYDPEGDTEAARRASRNSTALEEAGIVEGTFRAIMVIDPDQAESEPGEPPRRQPDTLRFTNGRFRIGVIEVNDALAECGPVPGTGQGVQ